MRTILFLLGLMAVSGWAAESKTITTLSCASADPHVASALVGSIRFDGKRNSFTRQELIDLVLGKKQRFVKPEKITYPMPSDVWINPVIQSLQDIEVKVSDVSARPSSALFFLITAENMSPRPVFCTAYVVTAL